MEEQFESEQNALLLQIALNFVLVIAVLIFALVRHDWSKNADDELNGERMDDNLPEQI